MKVLLTGAKGQLGQTIMNTAPDFISLIGVDRAACDITRKENIEAIITQENPDIIINCAAYTNVEKAEDEPEQAFLINRDACANLAESCVKADIPLIHISTDYVFDGKKKSAYIETDATNPLNAYGESKLAGEMAIKNICEKYIILRVSSVFSKNGNNFVNTMLRLFQSQKSIRVVNDQFQCPTSTRSIANAIFTICERIKTNPKWGIYHYCNNPATSWYEFALAIKEKARFKYPLTIEGILPISASEYVTKAKRPASSILNCGKIFEAFGIMQNEWMGELDDILSDR